jgi:hypothetical protein
MDNLADLEPTEYGMALLARRDVFDVVSNLAGTSARLRDHHLD